MAARVRHGDWQEDENLRDELVKYVRQNLRRKEILDLVQIKYPMYAWSPRTLTRRLQYFGIQFTDYSVDIDDVREAVEEEMNGPGSLLGYRALHQKIREVHGLSVPRNLVYAMMTEMNPQGLEERGGVGKPKRPQRKNAFISNVSKPRIFSSVISLLTQARHVEIIPPLIERLIKIMSELSQEVVPKMKQ